MRWNNKQNCPYKKDFKNGDTRIVTKFLWFWKTIDDETRWLEYAMIEEEFFSSYSVVHQENIHEWKEMRWVN